MPFTKEQIKIAALQLDPAEREALAEELIMSISGEFDHDLDDQTAAAINRAEEQIDRGQGIDFDQFAAEWRKKLAGR